jgi:hypothetical protein
VLARVGQYLELYEFTAHHNIHPSSPTHVLCTTNLWVFGFISVNATRIANATGDQVALRMLIELFFCRDHGLSPLL